MVAATTPAVWSGVSGDSTARPARDEHDDDHEPGQEHELAEPRRLDPLRVWFEGDAPAVTGTAAEPATLDDEIDLPADDDGMDGAAQDGAAPDGAAQGEQARHRRPAAGLLRRLGRARVSAPVEDLAVDPTSEASRPEEDPEQAEAEQAEAERLEAERVEAERAEVERLEAERVEAERAEAERAEAERLEAERVEAERLEAERAEATQEEDAAERAAAEERAELERIETEQAELEAAAEAARAKAEQAARREDARRAKDEERERRQAQKAERRTAKARAAAERRRGPESADPADDVPEPPDEVRSTPSRSVLALVAGTIGALGLLFSVLLAVGAFLVAVGTGDSGGLFSALATVSDVLTAPISGLISFSGENADKKEALVIWGLGAIVYLTIGLAAQSVLAKRTETVQA